MGQPVVHFEIAAKDAEKTREYYSALFGWEINADNPMNYGIIDREQNLGPDGIGIGGGIGGAPEGYESHLTFYVAVDDVEAALAKAEELGGKRLMGPMQVPGMELVLGHFADPEGHMVGVLRGE